MQCPYANMYIVLTLQVFETLWTTVARNCPDLAEEVSSIVDFQRVVNDHKHAEDIQASLGAA